MRRGTYTQGFARNASQSAFPGLWRGLVGLWSPSLGPTGLTLRDWSPGKPNDGALTNMDAATDWVVGEKGYALDYDGATKWTDLGLDLDQKGEVTITAWIKWDGSAGTQSIVAHLAAGGTASDYILEINRTANLLSGLRSSAAISVQGISVVSSNIWHHIALVISGSIGDWTAELFLDGNSNGSGADANNPNGSAGSRTAIGRSGATSSNYFDGQIDDVFVYNRALAQQEISAMFAGASPLTPRRRRVMKAPAVGIPIPLIMQQMDQYSGGAVL